MACSMAASVPSNQKNSLQRLTTLPRIVCTQKQKVCPTISNRSSERVSSIQFVYALSLFLTRPEAMFQQWLQQWLRPGNSCLVSRVDNVVEHQPAHKRVTKLICTVRTHTSMRVPAYTLSPAASAAPELRRHHHSGCTGAGPDVCRHPHGRQLAVGGPPTSAPLHQR